MLSQTPESEIVLTPDIAELVAEVRADAEAPTRTQMDVVVPPKVETPPGHADTPGRPLAEELRYRLGQQSLLARFGEFALRERDRQMLLDTACALCAEGLETPFSKVLVHSEARDRLVLLAGVGWRGDVEGKASLSVELDSPAGYAFQTGKPLISNHLENEQQFHTPKLLADHGIRRAINVLIRPEIDGEPFGVLEVDSPDEGQFDARDALFLDAFAAALGAALARQSTEARLLAAIEHQALLTREVSHRVKNSLTLISSLLNMQARGSSSDEVKAALTDAGARILAIGKVHDQLWRGADVQSVMLSDFLCSLVDAVADGSPNHTVRCEADDVAVPADIAIPLGLVVNEMVTNALKYAYGDEGGPVSVEGRVRDGRIEVTISDQGRGFDLDTARTSRSLGLRVIDSLVRQIDGTLENRPVGPGTRLVITAPGGG
ncbi:sensor histidine kinase [Brevundimonas subvibrioides]|uniref:sensor histidine kinase n=1 Tax=Brevundimonas subvibrioides TaxID=74313 RepID=UPI0002F4DA82